MKRRKRRHVEKNRRDKEDIIEASRNSSLSPSPSPLTLTRWCQLLDFPKISLAHDFSLDQFVQLRLLTLESIQNATPVSQIMTQCRHLCCILGLRVINCLANYRCAPLNWIWNLPRLKSYVTCLDLLDESEIWKLSAVSSSQWSFESVTTFPLFTHRCPSSQYDSFLS